MSLENIIKNLDELPFIKSILFIKEQQVVHFHPCLFIQIKLNKPIGKDEEGKINAVFLKHEKWLSYEFATFTICYKFGG